MVIWDHSLHTYYVIMQYLNSYTFYLQVNSFVCVLCTYIIMYMHNYVHVCIYIFMIYYILHLCSGPCYMHELDYTPVLH